MCIRDSSDTLGSNEGNTGFDILDGVVFVSDVAAVARVVVSGDGVTINEMCIRDSDRCNRIPVRCILAD